MPALRKRPTARRVSMSERRATLIDVISDRITANATDDQIDAEIRLFLFGSHSYSKHIAFPYFVSSPALQTTKLSKGQLSRLYKDIRKARSSERHRR